MTITTHASRTVDRDFVADHTVERDQRPMIANPTSFKVALFGANVTRGQGGLNLAENTIKLGNWGEVQARRAEGRSVRRSGVYPNCPLAGPFGPGSPLGAAVRDLHPGLAAATQSIQIFATCLIPFIHP